MAMQEVLEVALSMAKTQITVEQDPALMRVSDTPVIQADISRLIRETNWKPEIPLRNTIVDMLDDWRNKIMTMDL
jgi:GDP-4-dehydro-6-deoxy-D-mannose reductase